MREPDVNKIYEGTVLATSEEIRKRCGDNDQVLEAPDPADFVNRGEAPGKPSREVTRLIELMPQVARTYDAVLAQHASRTDDELREKIIEEHAHAKELSDTNEALFALLTSREQISKRAAFLQTLIVRARLESGELSASGARSELSTLMGMDTDARARLRDALEKERQL